MTETGRDEQAPAAPKQLVFVDQDIERVTRTLEHFQQLTRTKGCVLLDIDGHSFVTTGTMKITPETLGALVGSSWAATRDVAKILPADEFVSLTHQGPHESVQLTHVQDKVVLATIFDNKATTTQVIAFYLRETREQLAAVVREVSERKVAPIDLGQDFTGAAENALDDMFGEEGA